jgi:SAM-dependent methyltransferase
MTHSGPIVMPWPRSSVAGTATRWTWVAAASAQPFDTARFDLLMACNVSMDIDDLPSALKEIRRVMRPDGPLSMSVVHPFADRGCFATMEADASLVIEGSYFGRQRFDGVQEHDGMQMHLPDGRSPWRLPRPHWRRQDWQSPRCVNRFPASHRDASTWRAGSAFRYFSGCRHDRSRSDPDLRNRAVARQCHAMPLCRPGLRRQPSRPCTRSAT